MSKVRIAVLCSGGGTNFQAILSAQQAGMIEHGEVVLLISDHKDAYVLTRAMRNGVESAVVVMRKRSKRIVEDGDRTLFLSMVRALFSQRRKTIRNNLLSSPSFSSKGRERIEAAFAGAGLTGTERAETLGFDRLVPLMEGMR